MQQEEPEIVVDTIDLKHKILKTQYFDPHLLNYEQHLLQCYFDYNKPIQPINASKIQVFTITDEGTKQYKSLLMTDKNYFTIGNVGCKKFTTQNPLLPTVVMEINEVEFNDCKMEFMHLEVNYGNYFLQKNKTEYMNHLHNELQYRACQTTKELIWNQKEKSFKLNIRSLRKTLDYPLIFISEESLHSNLEAGGTYQIGTYANIQVLQMSGSLRECLQEQEGQSNLSVLYHGLKKRKQAKFLGIPQQVVEIFSKIYSTNGYDQFCQDYYGFSPETQNLILEILQAQVLRIKVTKQLNQCDCQWYIIANEKYQFELGRRNENDLVIHHSHVNGHHGRINFEPALKRWEIIDCNSRFGTWRVIKDDKYYLIDNYAKLKIGSIKIKLVVQLCDEHLQQSVSEPQTTNQIVEDILKM